MYIVTPQDGSNICLFEYYSDTYGYYNGTVEYKCTAEKEFSVKTLGEFR